MIADLRYFVAEALTSMSRNRAVSALSIGTIAVALTLLGAFLYFSTNLSAQLDRWSSEVQVQVYLLDGLDATALEAVRKRLEADPAVERIEHVPKEVALARFRSYFADLADLPDALGTNPLPASFEVRLKEGSRGPQEVEAFAASLRGQAGVEDVHYDTAWVERLHSLSAVAAAAGYLLGGVLLIAATFTTSNVIRLALLSRRDEIEILRLVGATRGFIRGPFLMEGLVQGTVGGLLALAFLGGLHLTVRRAGGANLFLALLTERFLPGPQAAALAAAGGVMGLAGAFLAVRKFLGRHV
jgi:cell division transport system permease protein